jgi:hypothetical protein
VAHLSGGRAEKFPKRVVTGWIRTQDLLKRDKGLRPLWYSIGSEQNRKMLFILAKRLLNLTKLKLNASVVAF